MPAATQFISHEQNQPFFDGLEKDADLLTVGQVAKIMHFSEEHIRRLIRQGALPAMKQLGNGSNFEYLINRDSLEEILRSDSGQSFRFLTVQQVAEILNYSEDRIRVFISSGLLPAMKPFGSRKYLIRFDDLMRF